MTNIINVSLDTKVEPNVLKIADHEVPRNSIKQAIRWQLTGSLTGGDFETFEWLEPKPPEGIFSDPVSGVHENSLTITDVNTSPESIGEWHYMITVSLHGKFISTEGTLHPETPGGPIIVNK